MGKAAGKYRAPAGVLLCILGVLAGACALRMSRRRDVENEIVKSTTARAKATSKAGLPHMSNPRRWAVDRAAKLSLPELVEDLGNVQTALMFTGMDNLTFNVYDEHCLSEYLPRNTEVIRLIEEGRRKPGVVGPLLRKRIRGLMASFPELYRRRQEDVPGEVFYTDKGQAIVAQYMHEAYAGAASLYILINIDHPGAPAALAEIVRSPMPNGLRIVESRGMLVWASDICIRGYADAEKEGVQALIDEHTRLLGPLSAPGAMDVRQEVSRWNAPWAVDDPLLAMTGVDRSEFATISVRAIPLIDSALHRGKGPLGRSRQERVLSNFTKIADKMGW